MSFWRLPARMAEQTRLSLVTSTHLTGRWLMLARITWIVLTLYMLVVSIASLPTGFAFLHQPCLADAVACNGNGGLTASQIQAIQELGLSVDTYAWSWLINNGIMALIFYALAGILFWRRSDDWMALLVALMFVCLGAIGTTNELQLRSSNWLIPENILNLINSLAILFTLALFPNGRFVPRWALWIILVYPAYVVFYVVLLRQLHVPGWTLYGNPFNAVAWFGCSGFLAIVQLYRYFRVSTPVEQQQSKWVAFSFFVLLVIGIAVGLTQPFILSLLHNGFLYLLYINSGSIVVLSIPLSVSVAILRYRLYEIDVIINRTLVYGTLTVSLAVIYAGLILGIQFLLHGLIQQTNDVALVVSTLIIAALFQPLRRRVHAIIDRRFYRKKYDAAATLTAFNATVRSEVDLSRLSDHLLGVVQEAMQPAHISLWLRPTEQAKVKEKI